MNPISKQLLLIVLVTSIIIGGTSCAQILFGVKGKVRPKDKNAVAILSERHGIGSSALLDSNYTDDVEALDKPKDVQKNLLQPLQFWLYEDNKLTYGIVNCYAGVRFLNLKWDLDSVGIASSPIDTEGLFQAATHFKLLSAGTAETKGEHAIILWSDFMGRQNRHFLKSVKRYLKQNPTVTAHYFNADNVFLRW